MIFMQQTVCVSYKKNVFGDWKRATAISLLLFGANTSRTLFFFIIKHANSWHF